MIPAYYTRYLDDNTYDLSRYVFVQEALRKRRREAVIFCQHPRLLSAGIQSRRESLKTNPLILRENNIGIYRVNRGGDYTAHEPGQCIIYPHIDLKKRGLRINQVVRKLLEITGEAIFAVWEIPTSNKIGAPGLYLPNGAKLVSIGIMFKSCFTSFGLSVNISNDLSTFQHIYPCGKSNLQMTSIVASGGDPAGKNDFIRDWSKRFHFWLRD